MIKELAPSTSEIIENAHRQSLDANHKIVYSYDAPTAEESLIWLVSLSEIWVVDSKETAAEVLYE